MSKPVRGLFVLFVAWVIVLFVTFETKNAELRPIIGFLAVISLVYGIIITVMYLRSDKETQNDSSEYNEQQPTSYKTEEIPQQKNEFVSKSGSEK